MSAQSEAARLVALLSPPKTKDSLDVLLVEAWRMSQRLGCANQDRLRRIARQEVLDYHLPASNTLMQRQLVEGASRTEYRATRFGLLVAAALDLDEARHLNRGYLVW